MPTEPADTEEPPQRFPNGPQNFAYQEGQRDKEREFQGCRRWVRVRAEERRAELRAARHRAEHGAKSVERSMARDRAEVLQALAGECDEIADRMGDWWLGPEVDSSEFLQGQDFPAADIVK